jgi:hypothetical protein
MSQSFSNLIPHIGGLPHSCHNGAWNSADAQVLVCLAAQIARKRGDVVRECTKLR